MHIANVTCSWESCGNTTWIVNIHFINIQCPLMLWAKFQGPTVQLWWTFYPFVSIQHLNLLYKLYLHVLWGYFPLFNFKIPARNLSLLLEPSCWFKLEMLYRCKLEAQLFKNFMTTLIHNILGSLSVDIQIYSPSFSFSSLFK